MKSWRRLLLALLALVLLAAACGSDDDGEEASTSDTEAEAPQQSGDVGTITVGSANFAESSIVASAYAQALEHAGYDVETKLDVGARDVYFKALEEGELSLIPEFLGSLTVYLEGEGDGDPDTAFGNLEKVLPEGFVALEPSPGQSANTFVVTKAKADELGLTKVSDLAGKDLTLGGPPECPERPFCMVGLKETYGIDFTGKFKPLDAGGPLTKEALEKGDIDVALLFTTEPAIKLKGWVELEDDKGLQQAENVVPIIAEDKLDDDVRALLNEISAKLDQETYTGLVTKVYVDGEDPEDVAKAWLEENGFLD